MSSRRRSLATGLLAAMLLSSVATGLQDVQSTTALVSAVTRALQQGDASMLADLVDFEARSIDGRARGTVILDWQIADETERLRERRLATKAWVNDKHEFLEQSFLYQFRELVDPDDGQGPVSGRIITQVVLKATRRGMYRDMLVFSTPEFRLIDLEFGEPYFPDSNPLGPGGLQPLPLVADQRGVAWPSSVAEFERRDARDLVYQLLHSNLPSETRRTIEFLHREPVSGAAALVDHLLQEQVRIAPDTLAQQLLIDALTTITGRRSTFRSRPESDMDESTWRATNRAEIMGWARWHARNGDSFVAAPVRDPLSPTYDERASERASGIGNPRAMDASGDRPVNTPGTPVDEAPPDRAPGQGGTPSGGTLSPPAESGPDPGPPAEPEAPPADNRSPKVRFRKSEAPEVGPLSPSAAALSVLTVSPPELGKPIDVIAESLVDIIPPGIARALNHWAGVVAELDLRVAWSGDEEFLVLGRADDETLVESLGTLARTRDLLEHLLPDIRSTQQREPVVVILLDRSGYESRFWRNLLDAMVVLDRLEASKADDMRSQPVGFYNRIRQVFVQPTWDIAGEDEFRLHNELAHKLAACLAVERCGHLPESLLWAFGHLAEVRLFDSVYQFNKTGFVAVDDHFDWPAKASRVIEKRSKRRSFDLARQFLGSAEASGDLGGHLLAWACVDFLFQERRDDLTQLLRDFAELHEQARPYGGALAYHGDPEATRAIIDLRMGPQAVDALLSHLKKLD